MSRYDLDGKVALVTGGARGIGFATAQVLIARGAKVAIVDLRADEVADSAAQLDAENAIGLVADVTDRAALQQAVAATVDRFGGLDVVVANAGIAARGATFAAMSSENIDRVINVDLFGVARTVEAALPQVTKRRGHVVMTSSIYAFTNGTGTAPYAMAKAGVEQLGRALRVELAGHGVGVSVAYFGFIDTAMVKEGIDADPLADALFDSLPGILHKRLQPPVAGEAIVRGIERNKARIIRPRRWAFLSTFRGITGPIGDRLMMRDRKLRAVVKELDSRASEEQKLTA